MTESIHSPAFTEFYLLSRRTCSVPGIFSEISSAGQRENNKPLSILRMCIRRGEYKDLEREPGFGGKQQPADGE